jgi:alkylhydroperoxidase family enzyme
MTRLDYPDLEGLTDQTKALIAGRPLINVLKMWAHSEPLLPLIAGLGATQFAALELTPRHRELVVLVVAHALDAPYVWNQHVGISGACGVTGAERDAIRRGEHGQLSDAPFGAADRAVIDFALAVVTGPRVSDSVFAAARQHLSDRAVVEAVSVAGYYFTIAKMTTTLEIESDEFADATVLDAGIDLARDSGVRGE